MSLFCVHCPHFHSAQVAAIRIAYDVVIGFVTVNAQNRFKSITLKIRKVDSLDKSS